MRTAANIASALVTASADGVPAVGRFRNPTGDWIGRRAGEGSLYATWDTPYVRVTAAPIILPATQWGLLVAWEELAIRVAKAMPVAKRATLEAEVSRWYALESRGWASDIIEDVRAYACRSAGITLGELLVRQGAERGSLVKDQAVLQRIVWTNGVTVG